MYNVFGDKMSNLENTEVLDLNIKNKKRKSKKKKRKEKIVISKEDHRKNIIYRTLPIMFIPFLTVLTIIATHSHRLVLAPISYAVNILLSLFIFLLVIGIFIHRKKFKSIKTNVLRVLSVIYIIGCTAFLFLLYGSYNGFREWLISTAMKTMNHQYLCQWFYSDDEIKEVLNKNYIVEVNEKTDTSLIDTDSDGNYVNEYDEQILKDKKGKDYKIIELTVNGQKAYLAAIYDPSKVKVAVTSAVGSYGQYVTTMAKNHDALLAINGGGFNDPNYTSSGGMPTGITIADGKIVTNNNYSSYTQSGGVIGMTNDNILVLMKNTTAQAAINAGVRDAVSWGPFLIVNGKESFIRGNGGWGYAARSAIGQRSDGIVLLLVVDSNTTRTSGATMVDLTEIMSNYGAVNAANLDGGTSSVFVLPKKQALKYIDSCNDAYCYINDPIDGGLNHETRAIATSIIVTK